MDADLIAELIAKRDWAKKYGDPSWVTFYTEQLGDLQGMGEEVQQPDPLQAITKSVAELANVAVKEAEQSDAWLVEFDRLQDVAVKESERDLDVLSTMVADLERVTDFIAQSRVRRAQRERLQAELLAHVRKRLG